ncbi:MAG TPA: histidinol dehydrogenase, partial [Geminicoccaceae bacterium]
MALRLDGRAPDFPARFAGLEARQRTQAADLRADVEAILARVAREGDAALLDYTARFDRQRLRPEQLRVGAEEIAAAVERCPARLR